MTESTDTEVKGKQEDEYTKTIGEIGPWQMLVFFITAVPVKLVLPNLHLGIVFMAPKTTYRCVERENSTDDLVNMTCYHDCKQYEYFSEFDSSIITQWDLVCERAWLADLTQTVCMLGVFIGSVIFGISSDRYGRRLTLIIAGTIESCSSLTLPFCPSLSSFIIVRFFIGVGTGGTMATAFVLLMEIFGPTKRDLLGIIFMLPLTVGNILMCVITYYYRTWRVFSFVLSVPTIMYLMNIFYLPESPKWLISVGRLEEASKVMTSAAKWNKLPTTDIKAKVDRIARDMASKKKFERKATPLDLVRLPSLRIKCLCCGLIWFTGAFISYGSTQFFGQTTSNVFLSMGLIAIIQVFGYFIGGFLSNTFGRRVAIITLILCSATGNCLLALLEEWYLKIAAGCLGISAMGAALTPIYVYTTELFPTVARNMGMGASSTANRVGSMLAPFVGGLRVKALWLPPTIFALASFIGVAACCFLPETRGKKLEDHLDETNCSE